MTATIPFRFGQGQGLQRSGADITEGGAYRQLDDVTLRYPNAVEIRSGHVAIGTDIEGGGALATPTALWWRDEELCAEASGRLYGRQECSPTEWRDVGPWTRYKQRLTTLANKAGIAQADVTTVVHGDDECTLVVYEASGASRLLVLGDDVEREISLGGVLQPRIERSLATKALVSYRDGSTLKYQVYSAGTLAAAANVGISAIAPRAWHHLAFSNNGTETYVWAAYTAAGEITFKFLDALARTLTWTRSIGESTANDLSLYLISAAGATFKIAWAVTGASFVEGGTDTITPAIPNVVAVFQRRDTLDDPGQACAVYATTDAALDVYVELDDTVTRRVQFWLLEDGNGEEFANELLHTYLYSAQQPVGGYSAAWISMAGDMALRNGYLLYAARTGEVVSRAWCNQTADSTDALRAARIQHTGVHTTDDGRLLVALPVDVESDTSGAEILSLVSLTPAAWNRPSNLDNLAVSAHGGYPRVYDGEAVGEYDWHTLPQFTLGVTAGSGYPLGLYSVACTWERTDRHGRVYRSAPTVVNIDKLADALLITVQYRGYGPTEHARVSLAIWRTVAGGATYFRCQTENALTGSELTLVSLIATDEDIATAEQLNIALQPSGPVAVTDFCAVTAGRIWAVHPQRDSVGVFTTPAIEGFSRHFVATNLTELPNGVSITGVYELDGRILLSGQRDWAYTHGQGPSAIGGGGFAEPQLLVSGYGLADYVLGIRSPAGVAFFSADGPKLLDRGLQVHGIGDAVRGVYFDDEQDCLSVEYHPTEECVVFYGGNGGATSESSVLIWHAETNRWASWSLVGPGCAASRGGQFAVIDQDEPLLADTASLADNGQTYVMAAGGSWLTNGKPLIGGLDFSALTLAGQWFGAHALEFDVYFDFSDTAEIEVEKLAADITAANAAGRPYIYRLEQGGRICLAVRFVIRQLADGTRGGRWESIDVHAQLKGVVPAQLPPELLMEAP